VGVLPTAARLYFPTRSGESSRQTAALLLATLPYRGLSRGQRIVFLTDWGIMRSRRTTARRVAVGHQCVGGHRLYGDDWSEPRRARRLGGGSFRARPIGTARSGQSGRTPHQGIQPQRTRTSVTRLSRRSYWVGSTNIIDSVTDVADAARLSSRGQQVHPVSSTVTAGGISMATYVATTCRAFPDGYNAPGRTASSQCVRTLGLRRRSGNLHLVIHGGRVGGAGKHWGRTGRRRVRDRPKTIADPWRDLGQRRCARLHGDPGERAGRTRPAGGLYQLCAVDNTFKGVRPLPSRQARARSIAVVVVFSARRARGSLLSSRSTPRHRLSPSRLDQ